ncbi:hypothetical protein AAG906_009688 [Vitis piasezkii]
MGRRKEKLMNLWFILTQREYFLCVCCACTDWDLSLVSEQVHDDKQGTDRASRGEAWRSSRRNAANGGSHRTNRDTGENIRPFSSKIAKLEFPRFSGDDPTEWLNRVDHLFHLGEANQWWQWFRKAFAEGQGSISWEAFEDEVRARLDPDSRLDERYPE